MNLRDPEVLELNELCGAVVDGRLTEAQRARLERWLKESHEARRHYVRALGQSASMHGYAAEVHAEAPEAPVAQAKSMRYALWWTAVVPAVAAWVIGLFFGERGAGDDLGPPPRPSEFVGQVTAAKTVQWISAPLWPGAHVRKGQKLELASGAAEITLDSGARMVLSGAAELEINSAWEASLRRGTLKATVPPEAVGFRVSNAAVEVVDLGTEFTMVADAHGAEVFVLKGEVAAAPRAALGGETILLREKESRRFAATGVSDVQDSERKFARLAEPLQFSRLILVTRWVHWSFDEADGDVFRAEVSGAGAENADARLQRSTMTERAAVRGEGRRGAAVRFDGRTYARAIAPGLSGTAPHTVSFWVRVPEDAPLSDAYSMVTWATKNKKLGNRHVGINWNRDRTEGPLGVLRTDFGGGHAFGSTSLRDGRWHHIAVCFSPGDDSADTPVQVRQYVDGCLESSTVIPGRKRAPAVEENAAMNDVVWLGRRIGPSGPLADHFRGEIDELFIADRALEPQEIVSLMNENRLPITILAAHR